MKARTLPVSSMLCSCCTTSSICSLDSVGNLAANRSTTSPRARNSSLTPIGKVSADRRTSSRLDYSGSIWAICGGPGPKRSYDGGRRAAGPVTVCRRAPLPSVRMQPAGTGMAVDTRTRHSRAVLDPTLLCPDITPFLPPRLAFRTVNSGQDGQRHRHPEDGGAQHQDDLQLSAHSPNFRTRWLRRTLRRSTSKPP